MAAPESNEKIDLAYVSANIDFQSCLTASQPRKCSCCARIRGTQGVRVCRPEPPEGESGGFRGQRYRRVSALLESLRCALTARQDQEPARGHPQGANFPGR
jgi:hypothetical protein